MFCLVIAVLFECFSSFIRWISANLCSFTVMPVILCVLMSTIILLHLFSVCDVCVIYLIHYVIYVILCVYYVCTVCVLFLVTIYLIFVVLCVLHIVVISVHYHYMLYSYLCTHQSIISSKLSINSSILEGGIAGFHSFE